MFINVHFPGDYVIIRMKTPFLEPFHWFFGLLRFFPCSSMLDSCCVQMIMAKVSVKCKFVDVVFVSFCLLNWIFGDHVGLYWQEGFLRCTRLFVGTQSFVYFLINKRRTRRFLHIIVWVIQIGMWFHLGSRSLLRDIRKWKQLCLF